MDRRPVASETTRQTIIRITRSYEIYLLLAILPLIFIGIDRTPPLWWDEGWTISVARNWVERGIYGLLLENQPRSPGLSGYFPVVSLVALSFSLFGIGIWQARVLMGVVTFGSMFGLYLLTRSLANRTVAVGAMLLAVLAPLRAELQPLVLGRQVLGETPSTFFLVFGFLFFYRSLKNAAWAVPACIFWGLALQSKAQVLPFWILSLSAMLAFVFRKKDWRSVCLILLTAGGSYFVFRLIDLFKALIFPVSYPSSNLDGLLGVSGAVFDLDARLTAIGNTFRYAAPVLAAAIYLIWKINRDQATADDRFHKNIVTTGVLGLIIPWIGWYAFLAMFWTRYLFTPTFLGRLVLSIAIYDGTRQFAFRKGVSDFLPNVRLWLRHSLNVRLLLGSFLHLLIVVWLALTGWFTVEATLLPLFSEQLIRVDVVADYLNQNTPPDAVMETYDSELFFLLERSYHYPPDNLHILFVRRYSLDENLEIPYAIQLPNPEYVVVGPFSAQWGVYTDLLAGGQYELIRAFPGYEIYQHPGD